MTTAIAEVRSFPEGGHARTIPNALREVKSAGYSAFYGPEFARARIQDPTNPKLTRWHQTLTGIYFGTTKFGTPVVIGAHRQHYLTNPNNIEAAIKHGLINGAAATPEVAREIPRLLEMEGEGVFVVDYRKWIDAKSGVMPLEKALTHPAANLILGGRARTEEYIESYHKIAVNKEQIGVWKANDLGAIPVARLGVCGSGIGADDGLDNYGRFAGGKWTGAEGAATQKTSPLEELAGTARDAGNDVLVINARDISATAYNALTGAK